MNDILRTLRLGIIDLLGVTIPGLILLLLLFFGCIAPSVLFFGDVVSRCEHIDRPPIVKSTNLTLIDKENNNTQLVSVLRNLPPLGHIQTSVILVIVLILAYVIGYILRMSTPDKLDEKSTSIVLEDMGKSTVIKDCWPIRLDEKDNKFPYWHFAEYLNHRKHKELAKYVKWDKDMRSKTCVNMMKLETSLRCPQLSAIIESNEAHIRLMFGTWSACCISLIPIYIGITVSVLGIFLSLFKPNQVLFDNPPQLSYIIWGFITLLLLLGTNASKKQIEKLFHYRRVRELFDVVACYHLACSEIKSSAQTQKRSKDTIAPGNDPYPPKDKEQ